MRNWLFGDSGVAALARGFAACACGADRDDGFFRQLVCQFLLLPPDAKRICLFLCFGARCSEYPEKTRRKSNCQTVCYCAASGSKLCGAWHFCLSWFIFVVSQP